jgi:hypothetical protein
MPEGQGPAPENAALIIGAVSGPQGLARDGHPSGRATAYLTRRVALRAEKES